MRHETHEAKRGKLSWSKNMQAESWMRPPANKTVLRNKIIPMGVVRTPVTRLRPVQFLIPRYVLCDFCWQAWCYDLVRKPSAEEVRILCRCMLPLFVARRAAVAGIVFSCDILARWADTAFSHTAARTRSQPLARSRPIESSLTREMEDGDKKGDLVCATRCGCLVAHVAL